jgi:uncharacterized LabA/DUF88 family protein
MKKIDELEKIAVLIDADNAQLDKIKPILDEVSTYGRIVVKKAYGDWKNPVLKHWEAELNRLAIKPEQQFAYTTGKNATDISLVIGAMDLLFTEMYDAFVLVASDSDYTPLAIRLRESGVHVFGAGENKTPQSFKNACDDFILTENLGVENETVSEEKAAPPEKAKQAAINEVHKLLKKAFDKYQNEDGFAYVSAAGSYIKRVKPDFNTLTYGFAKLPQLLEKFPKKYEMKRYKGKGSTIIAYKCL